TAHRETIPGATLEAAHRRSDSRSGRLGRHRVPAARGARRVERARALSRVRSLRAEALRPSRFATGRATCPLAARRSAPAKAIAGVDFPSALDRLAEGHARLGENTPHPQLVVTNHDVAAVHQFI